jgi:hypothetical protein
MRYSCWFCKKSVTTELPDDSVIRAILICPECIDAREVIILEKGENHEVPKMRREKSN